MKKLIVVVLAFYALNARSQVDQSKDFLYLYSDSVIHAEKVMLRHDMLGNLQLRVDSRKFPIDNVKFFNNKDGFFGNVRQLTFGRYNSFAERTAEGRINLYEQVIYDPQMYDRMYGFRERMRPRAVNVRMFYNKGFTDIKKISYSNLRRDMSDNPVSMDFLASYRKNLTTSRLMYGAAGASIIAAMVSFIINGTATEEMPTPGFAGPRSSRMSFKEANFTPSFILLGLGAGFAIGGYSFQSSGSKQLDKAVDAYNR